MSNLYFKIQQVCNNKIEHYNPVPRKIIDVNVYQNSQLVLSSVAKQYLYQEKNGKLIEERKQQKINFLKAERSALSFPLPRLPVSFVMQIQETNIQNKFLEYLNTIPVHFRVKQLNEFSEDLSIYSPLDTNLIINVEQLNFDFVKFFKELCNEYVTVFGNTKKNVHENSNEQEDIQESNNQKNNPNNESVYDEKELRKQQLNNETIAAINFFRFLLQIPYIPPFCVYAKQVIKCFDYDKNIQLQQLLKQLFKVELIQENFINSLTRKWKPSVFCQYVNHQLNETIDNEQELQKTEIMCQQYLEKSYNDSTDMLQSYCFQFVKLFYNCQIIPPYFFGTVISLLFGSQCYNYKETKYFLYKREGLLRWFLNKSIESFESVYKQGCFNKVLTSFDQIVTQLDEDYEIEENDVNNYENLLVFTHKLLLTKQANQKPPLLQNVKRLQKLLGQINQKFSKSKQIQQTIQQIQKTIYSFKFQK